MNDIDLCLQVEIEAWFPKTTNRKWPRPIWNPMVTWPMTLRDPKGQTRDHNTLTAKYLENGWTCYLETIAGLLW